MKESPFLFSVSPHNIFLRASSGSTNRAPASFSLYCIADSPSPDWQHPVHAWVLLLVRQCFEDQILNFNPEPGSA